jgi:hypothetical protein
MSRPLLLLFLLAVSTAACCCSSEAGVDGSEVFAKDAEAAMEQDVDYKGPALDAVLETMESQPLQHAVKVTVHCPSGGHALTALPAVRKQGYDVVDLVLETPAADEAVTMAFEDKTVRVPLGQGKGPVQVRVSVRQRRAPGADKAPFRLAKVLKRE